MNTRRVTEAEKVANLTGDWRKALNTHILARQQRRDTNMDWLGMEATLRAYIKATNNHDLDEIVAEFTNCGYELSR